MVCFLFFVIFDCQAMPKKEFSKIILTGAPGVGKTAVRLSLEISGERTISETAEDTIKYFKASGVKDLSELDVFQKTIARLQASREKLFDEDIHFNSMERVFLDRSIFDGFAYRIFRKQYECDDIIEVMKTMNLENYSKYVFFIEGNGNIEQTEVRSESLADAIKLEKHLKEFYSYLGFQIECVPYDALDFRKTFILEKLKQKRFRKKMFNAKTRVRLPEKIQVFFEEKKIRELNQRDFHRNVF
jgi:predicted ATPase